VTTAHRRATGAGSAEDAEQEQHRRVLQGSHDLREVADLRRRHDVRVVEGDDRRALRREAAEDPADHRPDPGRSGSCASPPWPRTAP